MAKKKRGKRIQVSNKLISSIPNKINLVIKNFILFLALALIFLFLYDASTDLTYKTLFPLLSILFGFVAVAFLIALLVFLILKLIKK